MSSVYNLLATFNSELRTTQLLQAQEEDEIANLEELWAQLSSEHEKLVQSVESLELQEKLANAELAKAETSKASLQKEFEDDQATLEELSEKANTKQEQLLELKNFRESKLKDFRRLQAHHRELYSKMPRVARYIQIKEKLKEMEELYTIKKDAMSKLEKEIQETLQRKNENWNSFKLICIKSAQKFQDIKRVQAEILTMEKQRKVLTTGSKFGSDWRVSSNFCNSNSGSRLRSLTKTQSLHSGPLKKTNPVLMMSNLNIRSPMAEKSSRWSSISTLRSPLPSIELGIKKGLCASKFTEYMESKQRQASTGIAELKDSIASESRRSTLSLLPSYNQLPPTRVQIKPVSVPIIREETIIKGTELPESSNSTQGQGIDLEETQESMDQEDETGINPENEQEEEVTNMEVQEEPEPSTINSPNNEFRFSSPPPPPPKTAKTVTFATPLQKPFNQSNQVDQTPKGTQQEFGPFTPTTNTTPTPLSNTSSFFDGLGFGFSSSSPNASNNSANTGGFDLFGNSFLGGGPEQNQSNKPQGSSDDTMSFFGWSPMQNSQLF